MSDNNSASEHTPDNTSEHMSEHISSLGSCLAIWLALLAGTTLTVAAAFIDLGPFNTIVALTIATTFPTLPAARTIPSYPHAKPETYSKPIAVRSGSVQPDPIGTT